MASSSSSVGSTTFLKGRPNADIDFDAPVLRWSATTRRLRGTYGGDLRLRVVRVYELPREADARNRADDARANRATGTGTGASTGGGDGRAAGKKAGRKRKTLNLNIYKYHAMPDYVPTIRLFSTTDNYSTRLGESLHRLVKRLYAVTNKRSHEAQIARRFIRLERARWTNSVDVYRARRTGGAAPSKRTAIPRRMRRADFSYMDPWGAAALEIHHCISLYRRKPLDLFRDFSPKSDDPARKYFIRNLLDHLLGRLDRRTFDGDDHEDYTEDDRRTIDIRDNKIYTNQLFRVNYTTYDVRRDQDVMNSSSLPFIMVHSPTSDESNAHPYWYAQILGVFNATVSRITAAERTDPVRVEFLWVRWMGEQRNYASGLVPGKLPMVGCMPDSDPHAFGFLDPSLVIRGAHLMPVFSRGKTNDLLPTLDKTAARFSGETMDWNHYYVGIFVDRDMLMRYVGGGIGHLDTGTSELNLRLTAEEDSDEETANAAAVQSGFESDSDETEDEGGFEDSDSDSGDEQTGGANFHAEDDEMDID
ncbi:hypothetical protein MKEN_01100300 [Mycena kentingensis (nom. inval.)]|nr:hypothetical protein MKEN_01100300 [Mycena kentingensis (nom. inval.)]